MTANRPPSTSQLRGCGPRLQPLTVRGELADDVLVAGITGLDDVRRPVSPAQLEDRRTDQSPAVVLCDRRARQPQFEQLLLS